jgi:protein involved in polysaccharide export with SLBB domain
MQLRAVRFSLWASLVLLAFFHSAAVFAQTPQHVVEAPTGTVREYRLDMGDKVKVTVYGEDDLSGEFSIDGSGRMSLPMLGPVPAAGLTLSQLSDSVTQLLTSKHYLVNPRVSAEVTNYRPFTILGEVNKPGEYPYENGMSVLNAVALAGGYTYHADQTTIFIRRKSGAREQEYPAKDETLVFPGDTVRVVERIF